MALIIDVDLSLHGFTDEEQIGNIKFDLRSDKHAHLR